MAIDAVGQLPKTFDEIVELPYEFAAGSQALFCHGLRSTLDLPDLVAMAAPRPRYVAAILRTATNYVFAQGGSSAVESRVLGLLAHPLHLVHPTIVALLSIPRCLS